MNICSNNRLCEVMSTPHCCQNVHNDASHLNIAVEQLCSAARVTVLPVKNVPSQETNLKLCQLLVPLRSLLSRRFRFRRHCGVSVPLWSVFSALLCAAGAGCTDAVVIVLFVFPGFLKGRHGYYFKILDKCTIKLTVNSKTFWLHNYRRLSHLLSAFTTSVYF